MTGVVTRTTGWHAGGMSPSPGTEQPASAESIKALAARLLTRGRTAGLDAVGITSADVLEPARTVLHSRKAMGLSGTMNFTYRNPDRSTDPTRSVPGAQAVIAGAMSYRRGNPATPTETAGRVARYSWRDHYDDLRQALDMVAAELREAGFKARVHCDDNSLVDRNVAYRAGLGWYGKNANLILPNLGSWVVLGAVVTDAPLPQSATPQSDGCGPCRRCFDGCPTGAILAPGVIDARRCLAWIVQAGGPIPREFREAVGDRIYGCDDCQDVCPPNRQLDSIDEPAPVEPESDPWVQILWILSASDEELLDRIGRWYIAKRDPNVVRRTALVVLGNIGDRFDEQTNAVLGRYLRDSNDILRGHAVWACRRLGLTHMVDELDEAIRASDPVIIEEMQGDVVERRIARLDGLAH